MQISEYVSLGHPDKVADYISSFLLDQYIKKDPKTRYAVECQIKGNVVNLAGEISSKAKFTPKQIKHFVKMAVDQVGYTKHYQRFWGKENTICGADLKVNTNITEQSPDIAQGLDGWGDQGIFFGCAYPRKDYDYLEGYMRFPGAPLKPLEHLSFYSIMIRSVITLSLINNACLVSLMRRSSISKFPLSICLCACDMR